MPLRGGRAVAGTGELWLVSITIYAAHNKRGQRHGGKVPRPGAHANAPTGGVRAAGTGKVLVGSPWPFIRRTTSAVSAAAARCRGRVRTPMPLRGACGLPVQAGLGRSAKPFTRRTNKATSPFTRRTTSAVSAAAARCRGRVRTPIPLRGACGLPVQAGLGRSPRPFSRRTTSAVSAANECEGITCLWQVTRNGSDEAERRERSPSGVVSAANVEELAAAGGQVSGEAAPASGSASQVHVSLSPDGEVRRAQPGPPEPSAGRQSRAHYPPGTTPVLAFKSCYPPGSLPVLDVMQSRV